VDLAVVTGVVTEAVIEGATGAESRTGAAPFTEVERFTEASVMRPVIAIPTINIVAADTMAVVASIVAAWRIAAVPIVAAIAADTPALRTGEEAAAGSR
jgi:hypothetical protein